MMVITDPVYAALSAPQRAVLALQAAWAGKRPDARLLIMSAPQRAEFDRLYVTAVRANVHLGRLIRTLHVQAAQQKLAVSAWEIESFHRAALAEVRLVLHPDEGSAAARVLEGGCALQCPLDLYALDETPAGERAGVLKAARDRLFGIVNRGYAAAEILEVIQGELGADPLHPDLRTLLDEMLETADDALFQTIAWLGPVVIPSDPLVEAELGSLMAGA